MMRQSELTRQEMNSLIINAAVRFLLTLLIMGFLIFLPAWTLDFWQAYLYLALLLVPMVPVLMYFLRKDPHFLKRRTQIIEKEKRQKIVQIISTLIFFSTFIVPGLDKRFSWSHVPIALVLVADALDLIGYSMVFFVFRQNSYASRILETEKGQKVISTGLYGIIRHPMYFGVLVMFFPAPIALGSYWGLIPAGLILVVIVQRILSEENLLKNNLEGYAEYCKKVKYRLIPFVW